MRISHIVPSLEERHGGPSKSVRALASAQADAGAAVELLATVDTAQPPPAGDDRAAIRLFPRTWPRRLSRSPGLRRHLAAGGADCLHHHSLWLLTLRYAAAAARRSGAPLVISPRGMLSPWAYAHHRGRKRLAETLIHPGALRQAAGWHATSAAEADDIRRLGFRQPVCVAPNGVDLPEPRELDAARTAWREICPGAADRPVALFYSRFHRKKRLLELIDLWLAAPRGDWLLLVAGVPEEYSCDELIARIAAPGGTARVAVFDGRNRPPPFALASLFLLPSHSENFGQVVAEALAAGVPALVTDGTPWAGLPRNDAGWCVPWTGYAAALAEALSRSRAELSAMGARGRQWAGRDFTWEMAARRLLEFYGSLRHE